MEGPGSKEAEDSDQRSRGEQLKEAGRAGSWACCREAVINWGQRPAPGGRNEWGWWESQSTHSGVGEAGHSPLLLKHASLWLARDFSLGLDQVFPASLRFPRTHAGPGCGRRAPLVLETPQLGTSETLSAGYGPLRLVALGGLGSCLGAQHSPP